MKRLLMKRLLIMMMGVSIFILGVVQTARSQDQQHLNTNQELLKTKLDKVSYAMGFETGKAFRSNNIKVDPKAFAAGMHDGAFGVKPALTETTMRGLLLDFQKQSAMKFQEKLRKVGVENEQIGKKFLAENKLQTGVHTLPSGLQYKVVKPGNGTMPTIGDAVKINYEGRLLNANGNIFDSSYETGKPVVLPIVDLIKGMQEALTKMKVGATWEIFIPNELAYGRRGAPPKIGPYQTLFFKVHLLSVEKK